MTDDLIFERKIEKLNQMIKSARKIVFFGGAGVSTASKIPDFRSSDGIYNQAYQYPAEVILSHDFFINHTDEFYQFYKDKMVYLDAKPNLVHQTLSKLEEKKILSSIITQNIDDLHQKAGSQNVVELHGSIERNYCMKCNQFYSLDQVLRQEGIPYCRCGGIIKPDVTLYDESLKPLMIELAIREISSADLLIVGGTSLNVYPAAAFINYFKGSYLVIINNEITKFDSKANLVINDDLVKVFSRIDI